MSYSILLPQTSNQLVFEWNMQLRMIRLEAASQWGNYKITDTLALFTLLTFPSWNAFIRYKLAVKVIYWTNFRQPDTKKALDMYRTGKAAQRLLPLTPLVQTGNQCMMQHLNKSRMVFKTWYFWLQRSFPRGWLTNARARSCSVMLLAPGSSPRRRPRPPSPRCSRSPSSAAAPAPTSRRCMRPGATTPRACTPPGTRISGEP